MPEEQQVTLADLVIEDLSSQLAGAFKSLSVAKARIKQLESFLRANADVLGLQSNGDGTMTAAMPTAPAPGDPPPPSRPARRAANNGVAAESVGSEA